MHLISLCVCLLIPGSHQQGQHAPQSLATLSRQLFTTWGRTVPFASGPKRSCNTAGTGRLFVVWSEVAGRWNIKAKRATAGTQRRINSCQGFLWAADGPSQTIRPLFFLRVILLIFVRDRNAESCEKWIKHIHLLIFTHFTWLYLLISNFSRAGQRT